MNFKERLNFLALQEQVVNLLIKTKVLEDTLIEKNILTKEEYQNKLKILSSSLSKELQPVYDQLNTLIKNIEEKATEINSSDKKLQ